MASQREMIARACLECLLESGVDKVSVRDICKQAKVSIGAFYIHFDSMDEAIVAAAMLDADLQHVQSMPDVAKTWDEYTGLFTDILELRRNERLRRRWRMMLQFVAKLAMSEWSSRSLAELDKITIEAFSASLARLKEDGVIALPLGIEATVESHIAQLVGTTYHLTIHKDADSQSVFENLKSGLAITAGLITQGNGRP